MNAERVVITCMGAITPNGLDVPSTWANDLGIGGFDRIGALSRRNDDPAGASRPFDAERGGFVLSEGTVVVVLETLTHARNVSSRTCDPFWGAALGEVHSPGVEPSSEEIVSSPRPRRPAVTPPSSSEGWSRPGSYSARSRGAFWSFQKVPGPL